MRKLKASCLCGGVELVVNDEFRYFGLCHCSQCRKLSGSAFSPFAGVPIENLKVVKGEDLISTYQKSPASELAFCSRCGSTLYGKRDDRGLYHLRAGILDDEPTQHPTGRIYLGSSAKWYDLDGRLNRHEVLPDGPGKL